MNIKLLEFTLNGDDIQVQVDPSDLLVDVLRDKFNLIGTKKGCGQGECGACTVIMNGEAVNACLVPAIKAMNSVVETIEGIGQPGNFHPLQEAFMDKGAIQCGFCTPGMIMSAKALLDVEPRPTRETVKKAIAGNLCRCTGYIKIEDAILEAAEKIKKNREGEA